MTLPRRRSRTRAVLVLALLAGLVAMHGLTGTASAETTRLGTPATAMGMGTAAGLASRGALHAPAPHSPHHGPSAAAHHPCLASVPTAGAVLETPADAVAAALAVARIPVADPASARARADRAPPDLDRLGISRT